MRCLEVAPLTWPVIVQHYLHLERRPQGRSLCSRPHSGESGRRQARGEASRPPALGLRLPQSWCCRSPTCQLPQSREAQDAGALRAARRACPQSRGGRRTCASVVDPARGWDRPRQAGEGGGGLYLWKKEKSEAGERSKVCLWPGRICPRQRQESPVKTQSPAHQPPAHQPRGESAHPGDRRGPRTPACCRALGGRRGRGQRRGWGWGRPSSGDAGRLASPPEAKVFSLAQPHAQASDTASRPRSPVPGRRLTPRHRSGPAVCPSMPRTAWPFPLGL